MTKILIVEDEKIVAKDIEARLLNLGYTVTGMAASGCEALAKVAETQPHLILMDIKLQGERDGISTAEEIRARFNLPVIYLTAYADPATLQRAKISTPFGYILKPFEERDFHMTIELALRQHEFQRAVERRAAQLALINDIGSKIAAELAPDTLLRRAAQLIQATFGYHHVALFLLEGEFARLRAIAGSYQAYLPPNYSQRLGQGIIGWVGNHGEKIVANDVGVEPRYFSCLADRSITQAEICLPIKVAGQTIGMLDIHSAHRHSFDQNDVLVLETLTDQIAIAVRKAQLYEQAQQEKEAFRQQQVLLQAILDHIPVMLCYLDLEGHCQWANREWERISGWSRTELQSHDLLAECYPEPETRQKVVNFILRAEGKWEDMQMRNRQGVLLDTRWATVRLADGPIIGIGEDMTEYKRLEAQLLQAQKLEAVGQLAGGLAHDFNNILTVILSYTHLLMRRSQADATVQRHLKNIEENTKRAANLTQQLLAFARKQIIKPQRINLNELILGIDKMLRRLIGEDIELVTLLAPNLGWVQADPSQLEQVVLNLAVNARDAMPHGGKLTLQTAQIALSPGDNDPLMGATASDYILLAVSDTGVGMTEEVKTRLFEPFFTTKEVGKGTGLGLATCFGIIQQSNGHITVESAVGHGATFKIYLPTVEGSAGASGQVDKADSLPHGNETILLVEDESEIRQLVMSALCEHGYRVLEASNGTEALHISKEQAETQPDLLVTDVIMPHLGGKALAERLRAAHSHLKVLYISGYTGGAVDEQMARPDTAFLHKPFSIPTLLLKVREVLDR